MPARIGAGLALAVIVLGALGVLSNPKPSPVPAGTAEATKRLQKEQAQSCNRQLSNDAAAQIYSLHSDARDQGG
jgi:hypothetical protein